MIELIVFGAIAWVVLTLFEPLVVYFDTKAACDRKYAPARARRAEIYAELAARHRQSPLYQQMVQQKNVKSAGGRQAGNNQMRRRAKKTKRSAGVIPAVSNGMGSISQTSHPYGRIVQHKK